MKALICPNCSAADWKEVDGYQVCTYCGTKIPISKEEQSVSNSLVGKWVSNEVGEKDTLIIEEDLTGVMVLEFSPNTMAVKEMGADDHDLHGYLRMAKMNIKLAKKRVVYSIDSNRLYEESYKNESWDSGILKSYFEVGTLIQLSENKILTLTDGDETIFEKVE